MTADMGGTVGFDVALDATLAHAKRTGCCGNDIWRGLLCGFHEGFRDGFDAALRAVRPLPPSDEVQS